MNTTRKGSGRPKNITKKSIEENVGEVESKGVESTEVENTISGEEVVAESVTIDEFSICSADITVKVESINVDAASDIDDYIENSVSLEQIDDIVNKFGIDDVMNFIKGKYELTVTKVTPPQKEPCRRTFESMIGKGRY